MERRGLKVNIGKTKLMVTGKENEEKVQSGQFPCGVCGRGVGVNSIECTVCRKWCHKRCSGLVNINRAVNFCCTACVRRRAGIAAIDESIVVEEGTVEEVGKFCYLGDMLDSEGGVERAVRMRVSTAWRKWREIAGLLVNRNIPLKSRGRVYDACIRPVLLYGAESWGLTQRMEEVLRGCDRRMLRYMAGVKWMDGVSSAEVAERCGVRETGVVLRAKRLRWFGHIKRSQADGALDRAMSVEVDGRRPRGRPRKTWRKCVDEDLAMVDAHEDDALDRGGWRQIIECLTS